MGRKQYYIDTIQYNIVLCIILKYMPPNISIYWRLTQKTTAIVMHGLLPIAICRNDSNMIKHYDINIITK